jgi:hypothetical protein
MNLNKKSQSRERSQKEMIPVLDLARVERKSTRKKNTSEETTPQASRSLRSTNTDIDLPPEIASKRSTRSIRRRSTSMRSDHYINHF